jgi:hypothetical protein
MYKERLNLQSDATCHDLTDKERAGDGEFADFNKNWIIGK